MIAARTALLPAAVALAAGLVLAGCGSSSGGAGRPSTQPAQPSSTGPAAPVAGPSLVGAAAVPAVTGAQGSKPTIAKPSGAAPTTLLAHDVLVGTGAAAAPGAQATVNYTLALYATGGIVQSSYDTGSPFPFTLGGGQVIPGFDRGVIGMKPGGRRELVIPPALGYGANAQQGIPANSTLIFVIDLVSLNGS